LTSVAWARRGSVIVTRRNHTPFYWLSSAWNLRIHSDIWRYQVFGSGFEIL